MKSALVNHDLQILSDGPAFGGRAGRVVSDHAGGLGMSSPLLKFGGGSVEILRDVLH